MADTLETKHIDKRTAERYLNRGVVDEKAYERHIKGLPDLAEKAAPVETIMTNVDLTDDEEDTPEEAGQA